MSNFALRILFDSVKARFASEGPEANVVFGPREKAKQINQGPGRANRVVFSPGDPSGKMGKYGGAKLARVPLAERRTRSLSTFYELCTVYVWGRNGDAANDEAEQYEAARLLHDYVVRAIYRSPVGHGSFTLSGPTWIRKDTERTNGAELFFLLEIEARVPDEAPAPGGQQTTPAEAEGPAKITTDTTADPPDLQTDGIDHVPPEP